jgi:hypothetical protein
MKLTLQREGVPLTAPQPSLPLGAPQGLRQGTGFSSLRAGKGLIYSLR